MFLFQPDDVNDQLVEMSFRAWLARVTDQHCPLVLNQGTLVKFFIKPGMTFTSHDLALNIGDLVSNVNWRVTLNL